MAEIGFPVVLDLGAVECLVVGAGRVAAMKLTSLLAAGAKVTVVAPDVIGTIEELAADGSIVLERRPYRPGEAADYLFVTTATGIKAIDGQVSADARAAGRLVNAADDPEHCTVLLPSVARRGSVTVAVSTTGRSPALAAWLRRQLEAALPRDIDVAADLLSSARAALRARGISTEDVGFGSIIGDVVDLVAHGQIDMATALLDSLGAEHP